MSTQRNRFQPDIGPINISEGGGLQVLANHYITGSVAIANSLPLPNGGTLNYFSFDVTIPALKDFTKAVVTDGRGKSGNSSPLMADTVAVPINNTTVRVFSNQSSTVDFNLTVTEFEGVTIHQGALENINTTSVQSAALGVTGLIIPFFSLNHARITDNTTLLRYCAQMFYDPVADKVTLRSQSAQSGAFNGIAGYYYIVEIN